VQARQVRHRELFEAPPDEAKLFPPDPRRVAARRLVDAGQVKIASALPQETRRVKTLKTPEGKVTREIVYRDWRLSGAAGEQPAVEIVLNDEERILFGTCGCAFFKENFLNKGPCEHMVALRLAAEGFRKDLPSSDAASGLTPPAPERAPRAQPEGQDEGELDSDEDEG
jgi:hypothetical protein